MFIIYSSTILKDVSGGGGSVTPTYITSGGHHLSLGLIIVDQQCTKVRSSICFMYIVQHIVYHIILNKNKSDDLVLISSSNIIRARCNTRVFCSMNNIWHFSNVQMIDILHTLFFFFVKNCLIKQRVQHGPYHHHRHPLFNMFSNWMVAEDKGIAVNHFFQIME